MNSKHLRLMLLSLFAGVAASSYVCNVSASARELDVISIKQTHAFFGRITVTASGDALRIDDKGLGFALVTKSPDWTVHIFRDKEKITYTESFAAFATAGLVSDFIVPLRGPVSRGPGAGEMQKKIMGFSIVSLHSPFFFEFLPMPGQSDQRIAIALNSALRTHPIDGFPITQVSILKSDLVAGSLMKNHSQQDLITTSIAKVKVLSDIFESPKGYATVKSLQEVVSGPNSKAQTDNIEEMLGPEPKHK